MRGFIFILFLFVSFNGVCQSNLVKGSNSLSLKYGFSKYSVPTFFNVQYNRAIHNKMMLRPGVFFEFGKVGFTKYKVGGVTLDLVGTVAHIKNKVFFNLAIGPQMGWEYLSTTKELPRMNNDKFIWGADVSGEVDFKINSRFSLKLDFTQWWLKSSNLGNWYWSTTIGGSFVL